MSADPSSRYRLYPGIIALLAVGLLVSSKPALADVAGAEALFQQGRELLEQGHTEEACDRFAESQRLDPSSGTLLNLASCHEKLGRIATAWAEFLASSRLALSQGRADRAQEAERRATELAAKLSRLTVSATAAPPGLIVMRGETAVAALGVAIPIDPGRYTINATAPGYQPWSTTVEFTGEAEQKEVSVPLLLPLAKPPEPARPVEPAPLRMPANDRPPVPDHPTESLPTGFWASAATTAASVGVGTVFGVLSLGSYDSASSQCPERIDCSESAMQARDRAEVQANVANVAFATAVIAGGVATWLFLAH